MATRTGTRGSDTLNGTNQDDTILGLGGRDTLNGNGGDDVIIAGSGGSDTIDGGAGTDTVVLSGAFADYSVSFTGARVLFTLGSGSNAVVEDVTGAEFVAFDDKLLRIVGAGSETTSIQAAVNAADVVDPSQPATVDSILVAPGNYSSEGRIQIADRTIEILGAAFGTSPGGSAPQTIIDGIDLTGAASLTLDGATLTGRTQPSGNGTSGILAASSGDLTVRNSTISARQNQDTNAAGIDVSGSSGDVTIDNVAFTGFTGASSVSSYGVYLNFDANTDRDVSITDSRFDLRSGGSTDLRSYGVALDGYGLGTGTLEVSGNTFSNSTWGLLIWDSADALTSAPDYSGISGNTFTDTNEAVGNIRNLTGFVITTGSNVSNGTTYDRFLVGTSDGDALVGNAGNELIAGNSGDDQIAGGAGNDRIYGGDGADTAKVDVSTDGADRVDLGSGLDTVNVSGASEIRVTFTSAEVGNNSVNDGGVAANNQDGGLAVRLQAEDGTGALTGPVGRYDDEGITFVGVDGAKFDVRDLVSGAARGNQFDAVTLGTSGADTITLAGTLNHYANGGGGNDAITTGSGNDFLVGGTGNDTLNGGAGSDTFLGGAGTDTLTGGAGNDLYVVDDIGDTLIEAAVGGVDTVSTSQLTSYRLDANFENLIYTGSSDFAATGNSLNNEITTGSGNDVLNGGSGNDRLNGGAGNDRYVIQGSDTINDVSGVDEAASSVQSLNLQNYVGIENGRLTGSRNLGLTGNTEANRLTGNDGGNAIVGGKGRDVITGGGGSDRFIFNDISETANTAASADYILDFEQAPDADTVGDMINLLRIDARTEGANSAGNNAFSFIGTNDFTAAGQLHYEVRGGDTFVSGNVNNDLAADFTIRLKGVVALNDGDFVL